MFKFTGYGHYRVIQREELIRKQAEEVKAAFANNECQFARVQYYNEEDVEDSKRIFAALLGEDMMRYIDFTWLLRNEEEQKEVSV